MITKLLTSLLLVLSASAFAENTVLFEPTFGYNAGSTYRLKFPEETKNLRGSGTSFGALLGYQFDSLQLGFEYLRSSFKTSDSSIRKDIQSNEYAFILGYDFIQRWRPYVGYVFTCNARSEIELENNKISSLHADVGNGYKVGVSYTVGKYVYVNLEYRILNFEKVEASGQKLGSDTMTSTFMLGLSSPLQLWY